MDTTDMLRILNILLALVTIPASFYLIRVVVSERKVIRKKVEGLNDILTLLFIGVGLGSVINATISTLGLLGITDVAHTLSLYRSIFVNSFFAFISWALAIFHRNIVRK